MDEHKIKFVADLYSRYSKGLTQYAFVLTNSWELAEDLVHNVFLVLLIRIDIVMAHPNPKGWLYKTLINIHGNESKRKYNSSEIPFSETAIEILNKTNQQTPENKESLFDILPTGLSAKERQLLLWHYGEQYSHAAIAKHLGISENACKKRVSRAMRHCSKLL